MSSDFLNKKSMVEVGALLELRYQRNVVVAPKSDFLKHINSLTKLIDFYE